MSEPVSAPVEHLDRGPLSRDEMAALVARDISYVTEEYVPQRIADSKLWLD